MDDFITVDRIDGTDNRVVNDDYTVPSQKRVIYCLIFTYRAYNSSRGELVCI